MSFAPKVNAPLGSQIHGSVVTCTLYVCTLHTYQCPHNGQVLLSQRSKYQHGDMGLLVHKHIYRKLLAHQRYIDMGLLVHKHIYRKLLAHQRYVFALPPLPLPSSPSLLPCLLQSCPKFQWTVHMLGGVKLNVFTTSVELLCTHNEY